MRPVELKVQPLRWSRAAWVLSGMTLLSCGGRSLETPARHQRLSTGVLARIENQDIALALVARIAETQSISLPQARDRAIADARLAAQAQRSLPLRVQGALERAAFSRTLLESLRLAAQDKGPITDAELRTLTEKRWIDLDRPPSVRTTHAVALKPAQGSAEGARRVAGQIREATRNILEPAAFQRAARAVPAGDVSVRAERLPFIAPDGRGISIATPREPAQGFDSTFAEAANRLENPGDQSQIVETRFGFHVILLEERLPERRIPELDRREALRAEVLSARALGLRTALVERLAASTPISVSRDVDRATAALLR